MIDIFVGNLSYDAGEAEVRNLFERFGYVTSVRIMTDRATHRSRGFAFVSMPLDDADEAIRGLSGATLKGRRLTVRESQNDRSLRTKSPRQSFAERDRVMSIFDALAPE